MTEKRYIHVRNWDKYQNPDVTRGKSTRAPWIKDHLSQLNDEEWLELGYADRGLLESLRLQYAANRGRGLLDSTANLARTLGQRVYRSQLERLNDAGFIEILPGKRQEDSRVDVDVDVDVDVEGQEQEQPLPEPEPYLGTPRNGHGSGTGTTSRPEGPELIGPTALAILQAARGNT